MTPFNLPTNDKGHVHRGPTGPLVLTPSGTQPSAGVTGPLGARGSGHEAQCHHLCPAVCHPAQWATPMPSFPVEVVM